MAITVKIPLVKYIKMNSLDKAIGKKIISDTGGSSGEFYYIDILGICRTKNGRDITTAHQAYIEIVVESYWDAVKLMESYGTTKITL